MVKKLQDISYFVSFCVEQYKHAKHLTGGEALATLDQYGVLDYLADNYEILHTQSHRWILEDIDEFIEIRQKHAEPHCRIADLQTGGSIPVPYSQSTGSHIIHQSKTD